MQCTDDLMKVDIVLLEDNIDPSSVYLEGMKGYPDPKCQPIIADHVASFQLSLLDFYECGVTRVVYKLNASFFLKKDILSICILTPIFLRKPFDL